MISNGFRVVRSAALAGVALSGGLLAASEAMAQATVEVADSVSENFEPTLNIIAGACSTTETVLSDGLTNNPGSPAVGEGYCPSNPPANFEVTFTFLPG